MGVIMKKFCFLADLKTGTIIVAVLSMIGCCIVFGRFTFLAVTATEEEPLLRNRNFSQHFSNRTIEHWEETIRMDYVTAGLYTICFLVSGLVVYGVVFVKNIRMIRAILFLYMAWTIIALLWNLCGFIYFYIDGATTSFVLALMLAVSIYFLLVVFSYEEKLKEKPGRHDEGVAYTQFANEPVAEASLGQDPQAVLERRGDKNKCIDTELPT